MEGLQGSLVSFFTKLEYSRSDILSSYRLGRISAVKLHAFSC